MNKIKPQVFAMALLIAIVLAACGGEDTESSDEGATAPDTIEEQPAQQEPPVEQPAAQEAPSDEESGEETPASEAETVPATEPVAEASGTCVSVSEASLAIRTLPDESGEVLGFLDNAQGLQVIRVDNDEWLKIVAPAGFSNFPDLWVWSGATESLACSQLPSFIEDPLAPAPSELAGGCALVSEPSVAVRTLPDASGDLLAYLPQGFGMVILSIDNEEWLRITAPEELEGFPDLWVWSGATDGIACSELLSGEQEVQPFATAGECVAVSEASVTIRTEPDSALGELGFVSQGVVMEVLSIDNVEWVKVVAPDEFGAYPDVWVWSGAVEVVTCS